MNLFNFSTLNVETLIIGVTHREGLSGERAVLNNGVKKLILLHAFKNKSDSIFFLAKLTGGICSVNVVNSYLGVFL